MRSLNDLAALLASRICHDLVSPVGAVVNGTDLIRELDGEDTSAEMDMIGASADRASSLLQFYRVAFGASEGSGGALARCILVSQADHFFTSENVALIWHGTAGEPMRRAQARLFFQLLMCARGLLGRRGRIEITLPDEGEDQISIAALPLSPVAGQTPVLDPDLVGMLATEPDIGDVTARRVEFALVHRSARALGQTISVTEAEGHVVLTAETPPPLQISLSAVR